MTFENKEKGTLAAKVIGAVFSFCITTTILFFILKITSRIHSANSMPYIAGILFLVISAGCLFKRMVYENTTIL